MVPSALEGRARVELGDPLVPEQQLALLILGWECTGCVCVCDGVRVGQG